MELSKERSTPTGTLRLDLTMALGRLHIVPALPSFVVRYPNLKLDVSLNDRVVDLIEEGIDAVVRIGSGPDSRLIMHRLATARHVICAAPAYLERYGEPEIPEDLRHYNCLNFFYPQNRRVYEWLFQRNGQDFRLPVDGNLHFDRAEALLDAAIGGTGLVQVYNYIAGTAIVQGKLRTVLEHYAAKGSPIAVLYPQRRHLSAKVRAFIEFMSGLMAQLQQQQIVE